MCHGCNVVYKSSSSLRKHLTNAQGPRCVAIRQNIISRNRCQASAGPSVKPATGAATTFGDKDSRLSPDRTNFSTPPSPNPNLNSPTESLHINGTPIDDPFGWGQEDEDELGAIGGVGPRQVDDDDSLDLGDDEELCKEPYLPDTGGLQMDEDEQHDLAHDFDDTGGNDHDDDSIWTDAIVVPFPQATAGTVVHDTGISGYASYRNQLGLIDANLESSANGMNGGLYAPFKSKLDWEIAHWAKLRGPGSTAMTELLSIDGVCLSH